MLSEDRLVVELDQEVVHIQVTMQEAMDLPIIANKTEQWVQTVINLNVCSSVVQD